MTPCRICGAFHGGTCPATSNNPWVNAIIKVVDPELERILAEEEEIERQERERNREKEQVVLV